MTLALSQTRRFFVFFVVSFVTICLARKILIDDVTRVINLCIVSHAVFDNNFQYERSHKKFLRSRMEWRIFEVYW